MTRLQRNLLAGLVVLGMFALLSATPASAALIVKYDFDEGSGTVVGNSGTGGAGTLTGTAAGSGWQTFAFSPGGGGFYHFPGIEPGDPGDDYVDTGLTINGIPIANGNPFTATAWVKVDVISPPGHGNGDNAIFGSGGPGGGQRFHMTVRGDRLHHGMWGGSDDLPGTDGTIAADIWYHTAFRYDGTMSTIFIDGVIDAGPTAKTSSVDENPLTIAAIPTQNRGLVGFLDDVRLYDTALSDGEIAALAVVVLPPTPAVPGDVDNNGVVEEADYIIIRDNFRNNVGTFMEGDLTGSDGIRDFEVDFYDFSEWATAFEAGGGSLAGLNLNPAGVPEPATGLLAVVALLIVGSLSRRRRA